MKLDNEDRQKIRDELQRYENPMQIRKASDEVNVDNALPIGNAIAYSFMAEIHLGFYTPIKKKVVTLEILKKRVKIGDTIIYDMDKSYARLLVISQNRDVHLSDVLQY